MEESIALVDAGSSWPIIAGFAVAVTLGIAFSICSAARIGAWKGAVTGIVACLLCIVASLAVIPASESAVEHMNTETFSKAYPSIPVTAETDAILTDPQPGAHAKVQGYDGMHDISVSREDGGLRLTVGPAR